MTLSANAHFNILKVSENVFPNWKQNFTKKHIAHQNHPFLIAEKFAMQARQVVTLKETIHRLNKLEQSSLWHSPEETHR